MTDDSADPHTVLSRVYEHYDYYELAGAELVIETEESTLTVAVEALNRGRTDSGRRWLSFGPERLFLEAEWRNGEPVDTTPWYDALGAKPEDIEAVAVEEVFAHV